MVMAVAALPVSELRGAIPLALLGYHMPPVVAYGLAVVGNMIPVVLVLPSLALLVHVLGQVEVFARVFRWLFARTRRRFSGPYARWGAVALVAFVALPLPMTGAWTGCLIAYLFGIPYRQSLLLIGLGVMIAGLIVTLSTLGILTLAFA
jgi:uncharacterized membrane protein